MATTQQPRIIRTYDVGVQSVAEGSGPCPVVGCSNG